MSNKDDVSGTSRPPDEDQAMENAARLETLLDQSKKIGEEIEFRHRQLSKDPHE